ncbi:23227_t:CDS:2 [Gigaspora margarita]|uniref:23227_t:CDS:1 n=1 Tax=Gigaspora margarita TaxID=4874 RepID=A0ABN7V4M3_GIGMA|nr:23227_t:CDS:2 [Gigaspora margarita]
MSLNNSEKPNVASEIANIGIKIGSSLASLNPILGAISDIIQYVWEINESAQYNKKIAKSIVGRLLSVDAALKFLLIQREDFCEKFKDLKYQESLHTLKNVLDKIKTFTEQVTQLRGLEKLILAQTIEKTYKELMEEYESCLSGLKFTMIIAFDEQKRIDNESLKSDIEETKKFMEDFANYHKEQTNLVYQEIKCVKNKIESSSDDSIDLRKIESNLLEEPPHGSSNDRRGKTTPIFKMIYRKAIDVACKPIKKITAVDEKILNAKLAIQRKLSDCPNILKFYGLSTLELNDVMVLEWAEKGNLKEIYESDEKLTWPLKAHIVFGICKGITYLNSVGVFHHDVRCQNVMMTANDEPKLTNFEYARNKNDKFSSDIGRKILDVIHWLAPEKMPEQLDKNVSNPYTQKCEIFSFGMLMWELASEKIPYKDMELNGIIRHVSDKKRESFDCFDNSELDPNNEINKDIQDEFKYLIKSAWKHVPEERIGISALYLRLSELSSVVKKSPSLLPVDSRVNKSLVIPEDSQQNANINKILTIEEGIKLHRSKFPGNKEKAWKCFEDNAKLKSPLAIYWKGYYLWHGSYQSGAKRSEEQMKKDQSEARELFKKAADEGVADAQFWYAFSLPRTEENREEFLDYLSKAAENGNAAALYSLGDVYLHGKAQVVKDQIKGLRYLTLAAQKGHVKANETLKTLNNSDMNDIDFDF